MNVNLYSCKEKTYSWFLFLPVSEMGAIADKFQSVTSKPPAKDIVYDDPNKRTSTLGYAACIRLSNKFHTRESAEEYMRKVSQDGFDFYNTCADLTQTFWRWHLREGQFNETKGENSTWACRGRNCRNEWVNAAHAAAECAPDEYLLSGDRDALRASHQRMIALRRELIQFDIKFNPENADKPFNKE